MRLDADTITRKVMNSLVRHDIHMARGYPIPVNGSALTTGEAHTGIMVGIPPEQGLMLPHRGDPGLLVVDIHRPEGKPNGIAITNSTWGEEEPRLLLDSDVHTPAQAMILIHQWGLRRAATLQLATN